MEELARSARNKDIGVVAIRDSGKCIGSFDTSSTQTCAIETNANDGVSAEILGQSTERRCLPINHRNRVTLLNQRGGKTRPDSAASNNDDVHFAPPPGVRVDTGADPMTAPRERKDEPTSVHIHVIKVGAPFPRDYDFSHTPPQRHRQPRPVLSSLSNAHGFARETPCRCNR
ncbi:unannotated protein [freshwater metagenome]|uniref:Unannotated protein n=1 Tax=freshwater metagenome TaxID=449393 RepID=A0A6J7LP68_9ZZZZ